MQLRAIFKFKSLPVHASTQRLLLSAELSVSESFCELEIILFKASSLCSISMLYFFTQPSLVSMSSWMRCFSLCICMIYSSIQLACILCCITSLLISSRRRRNSCTLPFNWLKQSYSAILFQICLSGLCLSSGELVFFKNYSF